ncbi:Uncharacterised protein [Achromobacter sp. 2789STDY5608633]|uniref:hypothetical protein n=1 Tax=Achromobacter sp. 2789STDY5608633 TaxID=1806501 RepID=UPI0006C47296|nr:hypothetical protein [Achromobacter sp. 2789STDY5608633]CUJ50241.1 Uncharacterised protein [Achromobacter sp. 2789STDY5608633]
MGYINPLLRLPAGRALQQLPKADRERIEAVMRELREQANTEAETAWRRRKAPMAAYWRAVSTYARHIAHALSSPDLASGPTLPANDLGTSHGGRAYVADYFANQLRRHEFTHYISEELAADFACALAQHLAKLQIRKVPHVPDAVWESLQRLIENGQVLGPASRHDARVVARYRDRQTFLRDPDRDAAAAGAKKDRAALGIPSCGKPLCSESLHHPLCQKHASDEDPTDEMTDEEIIDLAVEPLGIDCDRMPHGVVVFARALLDKAVARRAGSMLQFLADTGGAIETNRLDGRTIYRVWWPGTDKRQFEWYPSPEAAIEEAQHEQKDGEA